MKFRALHAASLYTRIPGGFARPGLLHRLIFVAIIKSYTRMSDACGELRNQRRIWRARQSGYAREIYWNKTRDRERKGGSEGHVSQRRRLYICESVYMKTFTTGVHVNVNSLPLNNLLRRHLRFIFHLGRKKKYNNQFLIRLHTRARARAHARKKGVNKEKYYVEIT